MNLKIGAKIKALRKRDDVKQERLADVLGVTSQAISRWESENGYPDIEYISPLANFFNVTTDYLFDHDLVEKRKKIYAYCEEFDVHRRHGKSPQERIDMMRKVIAQFPGEEQLLFRLAKALYHKWCDYGWHSRVVDGYGVSDYEKHRSFDSWEESVEIMENLLSSSTDDEIRSECRELLAYIYGRIGETEKVLAIANKCDDMSRSKQNILANALSINGKDSVKYRQEQLMTLLDTFRWSLVSAAFNTNDRKINNDAYIIILNLYKLVFNDGNYGFYNDSMASLYQHYTWRVLVPEERFDEAFNALECAYEHTKMFDMYIKDLRQKSIIQYTSPFANMMEENSQDVNATEMLPLLLSDLKNEDTIKSYKKFSDDPRYASLTDKIEADLRKQ